MKKYTLSLLLTLVLLAGCGPQPLQATDSAPQSWFDAPLPGPYGLETLQLVSHHSHAAGIVELEFLVNGILVEQVTLTGGESLVTDSRNWKPEGPGEYRLQMRARNSAGLWGNHADTLVLVGELPGPDQVEVFEEPPEEDGFFDKTLSGNQVYAGECSPSQVRFGIGLVYSGELDSVLLFHRLDTPNGQSTGWNAGSTLNAFGDGQYGLTLSGLALAQGTNYETGQISYQFVVEPASGDPDDFLRSPVYRDLQWTACEADPEPQPEELLPECSDGIDNDGDGFIDYAPPSIVGGIGDPDCSSPEDDSEGS